MSDLLEASLTTIATGINPEESNSVVKKVTLSRSINPTSEKEKQHLQPIISSPTLEDNDSRTKFASLFVDVRDIVSGTIDAETYILMERDAGKRWKKLENNKEIFVSSGNKDDKLNDLRLAVAAYIGYKNGDILGEKLSAASRRAKIEMNHELGGTGKEPRKQETRSIYVAGMPDPQQRFLQNLRSKHVVLTEQYEQSLKVNGEDASETKKLKVNLDKVKISLYKVTSK